METEHLPCEVAILRFLLLSERAALEKVDFDVVSEGVLEVQFVHGGACLVRRRVHHLCFAQADHLSLVIRSLLKSAALDCAVLRADALKLFLTQLFKYSRT